MACPLRGAVAVSLLLLVCGRALSRGGAVGPRGSGRVEEGCCLPSFRAALSAPLPPSGPSPRRGRAASAFPRCLKWERLFPPVAPGGAASSEAGGTPSPPPRFLPVRVITRAGAVLRNTKPTVGRCLPPCLARGRDSCHDPCAGASRSLVLV